MEPPCSATNEHSHADRDVSELLSHRKSDAESGEPAIV